MMTTWGDRATSKEAAQKLITTLVDWEVLRSTKTKGHFLLARKMTASIPDLQLWLLEALLGASAADEIEAQQLLRLPESFPFTLSVGVADLRRYEGFNIHRQGLDMDMVALRKVKVEPPPKPTKKPKKEKPAKTDQPQPFRYANCRGRFRQWAAQCLVVPATEVQQTCGRATPGSKSPSRTKSYERYRIGRLVSFMSVGWSVFPTAPSPPLRPSALNSSVTDITSAASH